MRWQSSCELKPSATGQGLVSIPRESDRLGRPPPGELINRWHQSSGAAYPHHPSTPTHPQRLHRLHRCCCCCCCIYTAIFASFKPQKRSIFNYISFHYFHPFFHALFVYFVFKNRFLKGTQQIHKKEERVFKARNDPAVFWRLLCVWDATSYLFAASLEEMYPPGICVTM